LTSAQVPRPYRLSARGGIFYTLSAIVLLAAQELDVVWCRSDRRKMYGDDFQVLGLRRHGAEDNFRH
jgi:hypothetical protein